MKEITPYTRKIYYYETDKMGIVHNSNYIRIFEETRMDLLDKIGMPFKKMEDNGIMSPIVSVECNYHKPLTFDDEFAVYSKIKKFNGAILVIEYTIINLKTGEVCTTGSSKQCMTDMNMKPIRIKHSHPEIFEHLSKYADYKVK